MEQIKVPTRARKIAFASYNDYREYLSDKNFTYLGSGAFGTCLRSPIEGMVVKIGFMYDADAKEAGQKYDGYFEWIRSVVQAQNEGKHSVGMPTVYGLNLYKAENGDVFYVAYLEELAEFRNRKGEIKHDLIKTYQIFKNLVLEIDTQYCNRGVFEPSEKWFEELTAQHYLDWTETNIEHVEAALDYLETAKHLVKVRRSGKSQKNATYDMHTGNVMLRGDQLVITDPIC
jgi:hypothetical protein